MRAPSGTRVGTTVTEQAQVQAREVRSNRGGGLMVASWAGSGWIVGLVSDNWIAYQPSHIPIWGHLILVILGPWLAAITIGVAMASITVGIVTFFHQLVFGR